MQSVLIYYLVLHMQSVLIMWCFMCKMPAQVGTAVAAQVQYLDFGAHGRALHDGIHEFADHLG